MWLQLLCRFNIHSWSKWINKSSGKLLDEDDPKVYIGTFVIQEKSCIYCDKLKLKMIKALT